MKSPKLIQTKLTNRTQAMESRYEVENNRYLYRLYFDESIGFDWLETQVEKTSKECGHELELWKLRGSVGPSCCVQVREVARREGIDDSQQGLDEF